MPEQESLRCLTKPFPHQSEHHEGDFRDHADDVITDEPAPSEFGHLYFLRAGKCNATAVVTSTLLRRLHTSASR